MTSTHRSHYFHLVWSTKQRQNLILPKMQDKLYSYMGGIIRNDGGSLMEIGGTANHVHLLVKFGNLDRFTTMIRDTKSRSTTLLKDTFPECQQFSWQGGYGSFTIHTSMVETTRKYIQNQEKHHQTETYENEYVKFLDFNGVEYDLRYVFD